MAEEAKSVSEKKTPEITSITAKKLGYICVGLLVLLLILKNAFGSGEKSDATTPNAEEDITISQETEEDLSISKDRFNYYDEVYLKLSGLQKEYEQEYARFGEVGFEEAKAIPKEAEFPKYGSIMREISSIYQSLPKFNFDMLPGEKYLILKLATYGSSLIFMTPKENGIEGMGFVLESKEILEKALDEVRDSNNF